MRRRTLGRIASRAKWRPWTEADVSALIKHSRIKTSVAGISQSMQRTPGAIRQKALSLNMSIGHRR
jgi:hypothetical protein